MRMKTVAGLLAILALCSGAALAVDAKSLSCDGREGGNNHRVCEMREMTVAMTGRLAVDATPNGLISVKGEERKDILVRARVEAWGGSGSESRDRLRDVQVRTDGSKVRAEGPEGAGWFRKDQKWSVSYEVLVPRNIDLALESVNGGISIANVSGALAIETVNGGISLASVNGRVKGETVNGGVSVDLAGSRWEGESLELETVNGGVTLAVPANYSATLKASAVNGGMSADFEGAQITGRWGPKEMNLNLGSGGAPIKVETVNGGVKVRKKT